MRCVLTFRRVTRFYVDVNEGYYHDAYDKQQSPTKPFRKQDDAKIQEACALVSIEAGCQMFLNCL